MIVNESSIFFSKKVVESLNHFLCMTKKERPDKLSGRSSHSD